MNVLQASPPFGTASSGPVVFLVSHSSPGGVQELWVDLATTLASRGLDSRLVALYPGKEAGATPHDSPWTFVVPSRPVSVLAQAALLRATVAYLRREKPSAVLTAMPAANVLGALSAWAARLGTRVIVSHHSPTDTYNRVLNALDGVTGSLRNVTDVVTVSQAVAASLAGKPARYRAKRRVIRNALPPAVTALIRDLVAARQHKPRGRVVVAAGRLSIEKNYPMLLGAAQRMPDVEVRIVGSGPEESTLKALASQLGISERVFFLGQRTRRETLEVLATGDVFVQPSLFEGHSLALLEAAGLHLPMVVSRVPAQVEGATAPDGTRCALMVELGDDAGLASAILALLDDEAQHAAWVTKAHHLATSSTYDQMIAAYVDLITGTSSSTG